MNFSILNFIGDLAADFQAVFHVPVGPEIAHQESRGMELSFSAQKFRENWGGSLNFQKKFQVHGSLKKYLRNTLQGANAFFWDKLPLCAFDIIGKLGNGQIVRITVSSSQSFYDSLVVLVIRISLCKRTGKNET